MHVPNGQWCRVEWSWGGFGSGVHKQWFGFQLGMDVAFEVDEEYLCPLIVSNRAPWRSQRLIPCWTQDDNDFHKELSRI